MTDHTPRASSGAIRWRFSLLELIRLGWYAPILLVPRRKAQPNIDADVRKWWSMPGVHGVHGNPPPGRAALLVLLATYREFRSLYYYRLRRSGEPLTRVLGILAAIAYPGERTLFLSCLDIGPGLFIQHGFSTIVVARRLGADCWINQQVTIGFRKNGESDGPLIGDGVHVGAGAKVIGDIIIGDGASIGANAVVLSDVPAGYTAVGVPARMFPTRDTAD